jgi:DNA repair protein RecN (Recombination protein N)
MLLSLKVQNYALIDELFVEFHPGLNIITGETGAGKSILLGALGLILGKRADTSVLSNSEQKCVVEAEFNIVSYNLKQLFDENDIDFDVHAVLRREILNNGKSRAFINDTPVNLNILQDLALKLIDIHSQHQNLMLNQPSYILDFIDAFGKCEQILTEYKSVYNLYKLKEKEYNTNLTAYNAIREEMDLLNFQFSQLKEANLMPDEKSIIEEELLQLENSGEIKSTLHETEEILNSEEQGIIDLLNTLSVKLDRIKGVFPKGGELSGRIVSTIIELKDIQDEIATSFEKLEFDPDRHQKLSDRLDMLNSLLQKFRKSDISELIEIKNELEKKIAVAIDGEFELNQQKKELDLLLKELNTKAKVLTDKRISVFSVIEENVMIMLKDMGIPHARIDFQHRTSELTLSGADEINLLFTANKNHPLQEVSKIASGGELSRLMLAVKAIISGSNNMPTLILDEIDTGVSGEIADKVGNIIKQMCKRIQIINITHLPQVASKGEAHYLVYKDHNHHTTRTLIKKLNDTERVYEIAKMLSGEQLSDAAVENARVLLGK